MTLDLQITDVKLTTRLRRVRSHPALRSLIKETNLTVNDLVLPLFIKGERGLKVAIPSMPGHYQIPLSMLKEEISQILSLGIKAVILFGIPSQKDPFAKESYQVDGIIQKALRIIKEITLDLLVICDVCLCEYTDHGHCGLIDKTSDCFVIENDTTLSVLAKQALSFVLAGADVIAPSGMMDGSVKFIREHLDESGFYSIPILSYSVKYASSFYGPFRAAAEGAPCFGDRKSHQMDPSNSAEALREVSCDIDEGADILMVKPAHSYLDVIFRIKQKHPEIPLCAYHTSGEFAMIKAAAQNGWVNEKEAALEVLTSIKRSGADFIISYYTKEIILKGWI